MADATLRFDRTAGRWEYLVGDITAWANTENPTSLLQVGRDATGHAVGFTFDIDVSDPSHAESIGAIRGEFGDEIAQRVSSEPIDDVEVLISTSSSLAETADDGVDVMRQDARLQRASSEVVITDDSTAGIVTVTMTVRGGRGSRSRGWRCAGAASATFCSRARCACAAAPQRRPCDTACHTAAPR